MHIRYGSKAFEKRILIKCQSRSTKVVWGHLRSKKRLSSLWEFCRYRKWCWNRKWRQKSWILTLNDNWFDNFCKNIILHRISVHLTQKATSVNKVIDDVIIWKWRHQHDYLWPSMASTDPIWPQNDPILAGKFLPYWFSEKIEKYFFLKILTKMKILKLLPFLAITHHHSNQKRYLCKNVWIVR